MVTDTHKGLGTVAGNGHCMVHLQQLHGVPHSSQLRRGERVSDMPNPPRGLVIATFNSAGRYANATDGSSHICILLDRTEGGLRVVDQYQSRPGGVAERTIRWKFGAGSAADDAGAYYAVETDDA